MGLQAFKVEGFRSLKSVEWRPASLNVLIGPNASGKSNLLRSLELVATAARGGLNEAILRKGGMAPLVWDGTAASIKFELTTDPVKPRGDPIKEALRYSFELRRIGSSGAFQISWEELAKYYEYEQGIRPTPYRFLFRRGPRTEIFDERDRRLGEPDAEIPSSETALSMFTPLWGNIVVAEFQKSLRQWCVYHDLRVDESAPIRQSAVTRVETIVAPDGQNLIPVLHTLYQDRQFENRIKQAMSAAFPEDFQELLFPPAEDGRIQLRVRWRRSNREPTAMDMSDGTLRFLLLLTILASPAPAPLIAIDEPETGLHPSMLPIIAEFAVEASRHSQVILSTHSPQVLDAFGDTRPAVTVFRWVEDHTDLRTISGDELAAWLEDYSLGRFAFSGEAEATL